MEGLAVAMKRWQYRLSLTFFIILAVSCITTENEAPEILAQPTGNMAGVTIITENGGHLAWSKKK
jgi:hypothetical protein